MIKNVEYSENSLLRYPGGKTRAVEIITRYFPSDITELVSPFFGGGSIELSLAAKGVKIYGYDIFKPLVEFWQCVFSHPVELSNAVSDYFPLTKQSFYELQKTQTKFKSKIERAAVYYVLNRSSFSGSTLSGGMSPDHPRFTQTSINRLKSFYNPNVKIKKADFKESLILHKNSFAYLDPPYLIKNSLYGKKGDAHKDFDHSGLAKILKKREKWILSYNECEEIHSLYNGFEMIIPYWKYGMSNDKASKEILIFSPDINPITNFFG
ncbi:MAG: hypothetical protein JWN78_487 [Bacteroidota bacterium]|nr:hypothetical protein [Bacteroidota bacterium]